MNEKLQPKEKLVLTASALAMLALSLIPGHGESSHTSKNGSEVDTVADVVQNKGAETSGPVMASIFIPLSLNERVVIPLPAEVTLFDSNDQAGVIENKDVYAD